jgi:2-isopropylmalate synthase
MSTADREFQLYDTTLRDGAQGEGLTLTVTDKLAIARLLDDFGVAFIEGGWPGAIPKDTEFFQRAAPELVLRNSVLAAFGATRRPNAATATDPQIAALLAAETSVVTLVAKSHVRHVDLALRTTLAENLAMIHDTVDHLVRAGRRVFLDAEHFFDGYLADPVYAAEVVRVAAEAGAEAVVLCDTNGGMLPDQVGDIVTATLAATGARLGIHCHDDGGCAVANTLFAVDAGVDHVQVTAHGHGERCGNANLFSVAANLVLKMGVPILDPDQLASMSDIAKAITAITATGSDQSEPYVGASAFAHKAGLHASALRVDSTLYQHIEPDLVGNTRRTLVSDMAGRASIELKAQELGYQLAAGSDVVGRITERIKALENRGYAYESADASFELLLREELFGDAAGQPFDVESWRLTVHQLDGDDAVLNRAEVTVRVREQRITATGEGSGPVNALDRALRLALRESFPELESLELVDYEVRILDGASGSAAITRVLTSFSHGTRRWQTLGVDADVVAASWHALQDAFRYAVLGVRAPDVEPDASLRRGELDRSGPPSGTARWEGSHALSEIGANHVRT